MLEFGISNSFRMKGSPLHTGVLDDLFKKVEGVVGKIDKIKSKITKEHKLLKGKNLLATLKVDDPKITKTFDFHTKANLNLDYKVSDKMKFSLGANIQNVGYNPAHDPGSPKKQPFYAGLTLNL